MKRRILRYMFARILKGRDDGQAMIEMAVVAGILLVLLVGAVELGQVAFTAIVVSNAAKAGVAYGTQSGVNASDTSGIAIAAGSDAPNIPGLVTNLNSSYSSYSSVPATQSGTFSGYTCSCSDGSASTCASSDCASSHIVETLTVNTQYYFSPVVHLPGIPSTFTLKGRASQVCLQ
jgi:Flp pilus assembly protein TadG